MQQLHCFEGRSLLCVFNIFFPLVQQSIELVNICTSFNFSPLCLSVRVQGADTVSFPSWGDPFGPGYELRVVRLPLLCIQMIPKSSLKKGRKIYCKDTTSALCVVKNLGLLLLQAATEETGDQKGGRGGSFKCGPESLHHNEDLGESSCAQSGFADQYAPAGNMCVVH